MRTRVRLLERILQDRSFQVSPFEVGPAKVGAGEVRLAQVRLAQLCALQVRPLQARPHEVGATQVGTREVGMAEFGPCKVRTPEIRPREVRSANVRPAELRCVVRPPVRGQAGATQVHAVEARPVEPGQKLGGNPFDNTNRVYSGSANDSMLNKNIARFGAKSIALDNLVPYETSGRVKRPLVTIHTTGDEVVPYWQELRYLNKVETSKKGQVTPIRIVRYGHCEFSSQEVLGAFNLLVSQVNQP